MKLIEAIISGDIALVRQLLEKGIDPNQYHDIARITPLHYAAQLNHLEITELLLAAGANKHLRNDDGLTPLDIARLHQHHSIIRRLEC